MADVNNQPQSEVLENKVEEYFIVKVNGMNVNANRTVNPTFFEIGHNVYSIRFPNREDAKTVADQLNGQAYQVIETTVRTGKSRSWLFGVRYQVIETTVRTRKMNPIK